MWELEISKSRQILWWFWGFGFKCIDSALASKDPFLHLNPLGSGTKGTVCANQVADICLEGKCRKRHMRKEAWNNANYLLWTLRWRKWRFTVRVFIFYLRFSLYYLFWKVAVRTVNGGLKKKSGEKIKQSQSPESKSEVPSYCCLPLVDWCIKGS